MRQKIGIIFICLGLLSIAGAIGLKYYNAWDDKRAAESSAVLTDMIQENILDYIETNQNSEEEDNIADDDNEDTENIPVVYIDNNTYLGILKIPALGLALPVNSEWSYAKLKNSPCRFSGSINKSLTVAAHNYKNHFGNLTALIPGDDVILTDVNGREHKYKVAESEPVRATAMGTMTVTAYPLTLFTCNYNGSARFAVRCSAAE